MMQQFDKWQYALDAIRKLDIKDKSLTEILVIAWTDGFNHALDLFVMCADELDRPEFKDGEDGGA